MQNTPPRSRSGSCSASRPDVFIERATVEAASDHVLTLFPHLRLLYQQRLTVAGRTERLLEELSTTPESQLPSDVQVILSLPGVGRIVTATLLAEASHLFYGPRLSTPSSPRRRCACYTTRRKTNRRADALWVQRSARQRALPLVPRRHAK